MRYAICYVSTASPGLTDAEIKKMLETAEKNNSRNDVKGLLLYSEGNFFEIIEGNKDHIIKLFSEIQNDKRHHNIIQIVGKEISSPAFDGFKTDIVTEKNKYNSKTLKSYLEPLEGMDPKTQQVAKGMLEVFIETSN